MYILTNFKFMLEYFFLITVGTVTPIHPSSHNIQHCFKRPAYNLLVPHTVTGLRHRVVVTSIDRTEFKLRRSSRQNIRCYSFDFRHALYHTRLIMCGEIIMPRVTKRFRQDYTQSTACIADNVNGERRNDDGRGV